jgi:hypothetical protein
VFQFRGGNAQIQLLFPSTDRQPVPKLSISHSKRCKGEQTIIHKRNRTR